MLVGGNGRLGDCPAPRLAATVRESSDMPPAEIVIDLPRWRDEALHHVDAIVAGAPGEEQIIAGDGLEVGAPRPREAREEFAAGAELRIAGVVDFVHRDAILRRIGLAPFG